MDGMLARGILKILAIFILILIPLLLSGLTISEASPMDDAIPAVKIVDVKNIFLTVAKCTPL